MKNIKNIVLVAAKWGGIVLGLLIVAMAGAYISIKISVIGTEVTVPDVRDVTVESAYGLLSDKGLFLEIEGEREDERIAQGRVISQDPPEGARIRKGRKVRIMLSLGARRIKTPDLSRETERSARIRVTEEDLIIGSLSHVSSELEEGAIIAQSPPPGSEKVRGGRVNILVSGGSEKKAYIMPDVVGKDYNDVEPALKYQGLRMNVVKKERTSGFRHGRIISQYPASGYPVSQGDAVSITIAD